MRHLLLGLVVSLAGTGCSEAVVETFEDDCTRIDPTAETDLVIASRATEVTVSREPIDVGGFEYFDPEVRFDRDTFIVRERWGLDRDEPGPTVCRRAGITISGTLAGSYMVEWYLEEETLPFAREPLEL